MKKLTLSLIVLFALSIGLQAQKYGYINTQELIIGLPEVKEANLVIEQMKDSLTAKGQSMVLSLQSKYKDLESRVNEISPNQLNKEKQTLQQEELALQQFDQSSQQLILQKSEELLNPIQNKINVAIQEVAKEGGYVYIFDAGVGNILYADESTDISELVLAKLNM